MKIAISGSHGVGKTTLARTLAEELGLPLISEIARKEAKRFGFETTEQIRKGRFLDISIYQLRVFYGQIREEEEQVIRRGGFVSDRSIFDPVAYAIYYMLDEKMIRMMTEDAVSHSNHYDLIVYCPVTGNPLEDDGFRLVDHDSQAEVDRILRKLLYQTRCPCLRLNKNREDWLRQVLLWV